MKKLMFVAILATLGLISNAANSPHLKKGKARNLKSKKIKTPISAIYGIEVTCANGTTGNVCCYATYAEAYAAIPSAVNAICNTNW